MVVEDRMQSPMTIPTQKQNPIERWLLLWLCLGGLLAWSWPRIFPWNVDPFVASQRFLRFGIAGIMFTIGCLLPRDELEQLGRRWHTVLVGTAVQYTVMPLFAFVLAYSFFSGSDLFIGIILVGCVPGAMASNVLTLAARGNVSYSISLTTLATLLSPAVVPFTLYLALRTQVPINPWQVFLNLLWMVVGPVVIGFLLCQRFSVLAEFMKRWGSPLANLLILWVIAAVVGINRDRMAQAGVMLIGALLALNLLGYAAGYLTATALRFPEGMRRALTIEVGMQNAGLGAALAVELFENQSAAAIPPALYTFGCMLTGAGLARLWRGVISS